MLRKLVKRFTSTEPASTGNAEPVFDPADPDFVRDPYPLFAKLRNEYPLLMSPAGAWVMSRYDDIRAALADERLGNAPSRYAVVHPKNRERFVCADVANNTLPFMDGPDHKRIRRIIAPEFLAHVRGGAVDPQEIARDTLVPLAGGGAFDAMSEFATPFALNVLCRVLGFPQEDGPRLKTWSDYFFYLFAMMPSVEVRDEVDRALEAFREYTAGIVETRKRERGDDFISRLLDKRDQGVRLSDTELIDNCMLLFADGIGNVDSGICNMLATLLRHPDQLELLREDAALIPNAVNECLRFEAPGQFIARVASEDMTLLGRDVKKNQGVLLVLASANRDAGKFPDPDRFDIRRENSSEALSFGRGAHGCVGGWLVHQEMQAVLEVFLETFGAMRLAGDSLKWRQRFAHRWLEELPLSVTPHDGE